MTASYAIPVRWASALPVASFRFHLTVDTLAVRLTVPPAKPVEDSHLQVDAPCRAHKSKNPLQTKEDSNYLSYFLHPYAGAIQIRFIGSHLSHPKRDSTPFYNQIPI